MPFNFTPYEMNEGGGNLVANGFEEKEAANCEMGGRYELMLTYTKVVLKGDGIAQFTIYVIFATVSVDIY